jgi:tripartite-type tricarboxylate transporter receptor subunit TctC
MNVGLLFLVGLLSLGLLTGGCSLQSNTVANQYPTKPITLIVPFAAGGSVDMMARTIEKVALRHLGQAIVVTNIPGGAATIGWNELAGAKPDGYTIGVIGMSSLLQPLYGETRYHYPTALEPFVQVISIPAIAVVRADQPWKDARDLLDYAQQHPGEIKYGHPGLGTGNHVAGEMVALSSGAHMAQVPFKGEADALAALLGGHIQLMFATPPSIKEHLKSGKVRVVGVATEQRLTDPVFSNVPTFKEQGVDVLLSFWYGFGAPKGIPEAEKSKLIAGLQAMVNDPEFKTNMEKSGMPVEYLGAQEFQQKWITDSGRLAKIVKDTGIAERIANQKK